MANKEKETTTKVPANAAPKMISVEEANAQMQALMRQGQQKMQELAAQCRQLETIVRDRTVDQLFKVIENGHLFNEKFVARCVELIEDYLTRMTTDSAKEETPAEKKKDTKEE